MVSAAFPSPLASVREKKEVVHFLLHDHIDEATNGGSFAERVCRVVDSSMSWRFVAEHPKPVDAWEILITRLESLAERNQIRLKSE